MAQPVAVNSPYSVVFLLHIALESPLAIQAFWSPMSFPFIQLTNTTLVLVKLYAALVAGTCLAALLTFNLPEFLPGKRALAMALCFYHVTCSTVLYGAPRFIPHSFGDFAESFRATPENVWGTLHGFVGLLFAVWWQATVHLAAMARKAQ